MRLSGQFSTRTDAASLRGVASSPNVLASVSTLSDVSLESDGTVTALFCPVTSLGRIPLRTRIAQKAVSERTASLNVVGRRGSQLVAVDLELTITPDGAGSRVGWEAEVFVGGTAASVGQRVIADLARRAIAQVLEEAATVANTVRA